MNSNKPALLADKWENDQINRNVMIWLNVYEDVPDNVSRIDYEQLSADRTSMAFSVIQGAYITRRYVVGGHMAEYQFKVIYRIKPNGSPDKRLEADEALDELGNWCTQNPPDLGDGITVRKVEMTARAAMFAAYENGDEDHQILMKITYEFIKG